MNPTHIRNYSRWLDSTPEDVEKNKKFKTQCSVANAKSSKKYYSKKFRGR